MVFDYPSNFTNSEQVKHNVLITLLGVGINRNQALWLIAGLRYIVIVFRI